MRLLGSAPKSRPMLIRKAAIANIASGRTGKQNILNDNVDEEYHEERDPAAA